MISQYFTESSRRKLQANGQMQKRIPVAGRFLPLMFKILTTQLAPESSQELLPLVSLP
jgi:hypothetical protein